MGKRVDEPRCRDATDQRDELLAQIAQIIEATEKRPEPAPHPPPHAFAQRGA